jgi:signal transduction histidine kinase/ActR/RegA family two-component response regulator
VLGVFAYLRNSFGSLFMVTLPHFWMFSRTPRASILFLGLATGSTLTGSWLRLGNSPKFFGETLVPVVIVVAVGVLIGLWVHSVVAQSHERARLIVELEQTQAELSEAHQRQGAADERERMARDIHDTLAQGFASIIVLAEAARAGLDTAEPARSAQQLRSIESTARENLAEARELVGSAQQQGQVAAGSVAQTLRRTLDRFAEDTGLAVDADLADIECDQPTRIALLRCTQESLANVRKHARASTVGVVLARQPYGVELEVTDDGAGFVVGRVGGVRARRDAQAAGGAGRGADGDEFGGGRDAGPGDDFDGRSGCSGPRDDGSGGRGCRRPRGFRGGRGGRGDPRGRVRRRRGDGMSGRTLRIVVVDDHTVMRAGVVALLASEPSIEIVGEAGDGQAALELVAAHEPDVALVDLRMPVLDGVATTTEIVAAHPRTRVLILTTYDTDAEIERGVEAGAIGYLLKDTTREQLVDAIHAAARGETGC